MGITKKIADVEYVTSKTTEIAGGTADTALNNAKSYTDTKISNLVNSAPETLNTLNELAAALGDDPNFATTVLTQIGTKLDKVLTSECYGPTLPAAGTKGRIFFKEVT